MKINDEENGWKSLKTESMDDLWYLKNILSKEMLVKKTVMRREEKKDDMERSKESKRKPVTVTIQPESVDFQPFTDRLRITGIIREGPEGLAGQHQSLVISADDDVEIWMESWDRLTEDLLKESLIKSSSGAIFVSMDDESASVYTLRDYGLYLNGKIDSGKSGKAYNVNYSRNAYFDEIEKFLMGINGDFPVIITGAGFEGEYFLKYLQEKKFPKKVFQFPSSNSEDGAIYEIIGKEQVRRILGNSRLSREREAMEQFLRELGKNGNCAYGLEEIKKYAEAGAISKLIVLENLIRERNVVQIMELARSSGSEIIIASDSGQYGEMLKGFGGYVALTRYRL
ncbi:mRNA surveillance protein pelota [Cuniculiplasma sp. SKW4]|uniref:mRNA surveillance protein pelota n=1 Tax=Cuniculiplasma sp. SKW4 TaxID=3400171 RepID=UPI003FCFD7D5